MIRRPPRSTLFSLHDALPICKLAAVLPMLEEASIQVREAARELERYRETLDVDAARRSEEHTSELQSQSNLVCRLLLEKKNQTHAPHLDYPPHGQRTLPAYAS